MFTALFKLCLGVFLIALGILILFCVVGNVPTDGGFAKFFVGILCWSGLGAFITFVPASAGW